MPIKAMAHALMSLLTFLATTIYSGEDVQASMPPPDDSQYCDFWTAMVELHFQVDIAPAPRRPSRELQLLKLDAELAGLERAVILAKAQQHIPSSSSERWASLVDVRFGVDLARKPGESSEVQARKIADEVARLDNAVALAKKRRNTLSTASRLPPDVWSNIFVVVRDIWPPSWRYAMRGPSVFDPGYLQLPSICSTWHAVALSTPNLWTRLHYEITSDSKIHPAKFLQRSGILPLQLHFMGYDSLPDLSTWIQPSTLHRISSLSLDEAPRSDFDELARHLVARMDCLKELRISLDGPSEQDYILPVDFLRGTRLTRLSLDNCSLAWDHSLFSSRLTDLTLSGWGPDCQPAASFPSFAQLEDVLARMTSLQRLDICDVYPIGPDITPSAVTLPVTCRMAKFETKFCQMECLRLLSHLIVPPECTIDAGIWARDDSDSEEEYSFAAPGTARFDTHWDPEDYDSDYDSVKSLRDWRYELEDHKRNEGLYDEDDEDDEDASEAELESRWVSQWRVDRHEDGRRRWKENQRVEMAQLRTWNTQAALKGAMTNLYRLGRQQRDTCTPRELVVSPDGLHFHQHELPRAEWTTFAGYTGFPREEPHAPEYSGSTYFGVTSHRSDYHEPKEALCLSYYMVFQLPLRGLRAISFSRTAAAKVNRLWDEDVFTSSLAGVCRLGVDAGGGIGLLKALATVDARTRKFKVLPLLQIIHIHVDRRDHTPSNYPEQEMKELVNLIKERRRWKSPLQELVVERSMAWQSMWEKILKPLIPVTFCDFRRVAINHHR